MTRERLSVLVLLALTLLAVIGCAILLSLAIVGGILVIGTSGIILGPVLLAVTVTLLDVWRSRTVAGRPAEIPQP